MNRMIFAVFCVCAFASAIGQGFNRTGGVSGSAGASGAGWGDVSSALQADQARKSETAPVQIRAQSMTPAQTKAVFNDQISGMYGKAGTNVIVQTHRWRYVGDGSWNKQSCAILVRVLQHLEGCRYRAESLRWHSTLCKFVSADDEAYVVDLHLARKDKEGYRPVEMTDKEQAFLADGQQLALASLEDTGHVYSYISVAGAKTTVRVMTGLLECLPLSYDQFRQALSKGQTFDVLLPRNVTCQACEGRGVVARDHNDRGKIGTPYCQTCKGRKEHTARVLHRIVP